MKGFVITTILFCLVAINCSKPKPMPAYIDEGQRVDSSLNPIDIENIYYQKNKSKNIIKDAETAVKVAEAILVSIYGENMIAKEKPFSVTLYNDKIWSIHGNNGKGRQGFHGGNAEILIRKDNGTVLSVSHGE